MEFDFSTILLIIGIIVLVIVLIVLLGGPMAVGGMTMMAGMMGSPVGWIALILIGLIALAGYLFYFA
ncbi:MAG: hypothetical protein IZT55_04625 [Anaerolineae bacterium]|nr:hypothetical protein [Anaerolineae bacterium]